MAFAMTEVVSTSLTSEPVLESRAWLQVWYHHRHHAYKGMGCHCSVAA